MHKIRIRERQLFSTTVFLAVVSLGVIVTKLVETEWIVLQLQRRKMYLITQQ